jgi:hypothetical protein
MLNQEGVAVISINSHTRALALMPFFSRVRQNVHSTEVSSAHAGLLLGVSGLQRALAIAALYRSRGVQADACLWCVNVTLLHGLDMCTTCCYRYYYPTTCSKCMPSMSSLPRRSKGWSSYNYTSFDMVYNILRVSMHQAPTTPHQECSQRTSPATFRSPCLVGGP